MERLQNWCDMLHASRTSIRSQCLSYITIRSQHWCIHLSVCYYLLYVEEVIFLQWSVCLSVCEISQKVVNGF